jgi:hypothetical protein
MSVRCPNCSTPLGEDGPCEVHGRLRASEYGLRLDGEFECANCETPLIVEDAGDGVLGTLSPRQFEGRGYRA